jgi:hypothetical protein
MPFASYFILTSTNVTLPLSNWTRIATNQFNASGGFASTNSVSSSTTQQFYLLQLP